MSRPFEKCRLCGNQAELCESHIIPKFVYRWLKATGSPGFRNPLIPNKRAKDGAKLYLLCQECEDRFNTAETEFTNTAFYPVVTDGVSAFSYSNQLYYLAISLFWRRAVTSKFPAGSLTARILAKKDADWRPFLLGAENSTPSDEVHMVVMRAMPGVSPTPFWNLFVTRDPDLAVAETDDGPRFIYAKLGPFIFFVSISMHHPVGITGAAVDPFGGVYHEGWHMEEEISAFLVDRCRDVRGKIEEGMSLRQKQKVSDAMLRAIEEGSDSPHSRMIALDLFESQILGSSRGVPGRNEACPCGSGKKFKRCHGRG